LVKLLIQFGIHFDVIMTKKTFFICLSFVFAASLSFGQFNVKIGYGLGFAQASVNNSLIQASNAQLTGIDGDVNFEEPLPELNSMYGIVLGFRIKVSDTNAFEFSWENLSRERSSFGVIRDSDILFEQELTYAFNQFSLGYQSQFGNLGLGTALGYNRVKIKRAISSSDKKITIVPDSQYFVKFNLSYTIESNRSVALSIQPYYQFPLSNVNLDGLADFLDLPGASDTSESFPMFGVSFIFYNGRQR